ncbi:hypothetical protein D6C93_04766, partial [Aureobasidium pullulans]
MASKRLGYLHVWYDPEISGLESKVDVIVVKVSSKSECSGYEHENIDLDIGAESYWPTRNLSANIPAAWMAVYYCALIRPGTSLRENLWRCARHLLELLQSERQKRPEIVRTLSNIYLKWLLMTSRAGRDPLCSWATTWAVSLVVQEAVLRTVFDPNYVRIRSRIAGTALVGAPARGSTYFEIREWCDRSFRADPSVFDFLLSEVEDLLETSKLFWDLCEDLHVLSFVTKERTSFLDPEEEGLFGSILAPDPRLVSSAGNVSDNMETALHAIERKYPLQRNTHQKHQSAAGEAILPEGIERRFMLREIEIPYENSNSGANLLQQEQRANSFTTPPMLRPPPIIRPSPAPSGTLPHPFKLGFDEYAAEHNREHSLDRPLPRPPRSRNRDLRSSESEFQSQMPASTPAEPKESPRINPFTGEPIKQRAAGSKLASLLATTTTLSGKDSVPRSFRSNESYPHSRYTSSDTSSRYRSKGSSNQIHRRSDYTSSEISSWGGSEEGGIKLIMPLSGELALGDIGDREVSFPMAEPQMIPSNAVPTTSYQTPAAEFTTPSPPQRRSLADTQRHYPSIAPNPAGLVSKRRQEQEDGEAMLRSNSKHRKRTPLLEHLNDEERLLITLKEDEALPWKEIAACFSDQSGQSITVATLQMRYLLLRQRLRDWEERDLEALRQMEIRDWEERDLEALRQMEIGGKGNRGRKSTKSATSRSRTESPSTMRFNARSHAEERDQDPTHEHHHMLSLEETPRVDARNTRPEASASRQTISHSDKEAYFVLFAAELQKLITCVTGDRQVSIRSDQAEEESYPSTKTQSYRALEFLLDQSMTTDLELQSCCDALEAALDQSLTVSELIILESKVDLGALIHHSIQRGQVQLTRSLLEFVAKSKTPHKALSAKRAAHFYAIHAIAASALSLSTSNIPDLQVWQALEDRVEICCLFAEPDMSPSESPKDYNFMFQEFLGLTQSKANYYQISLHAWEIPEMIKGWTQGLTVSYQDITAN